MLANRGMRTLIWAVGAYPTCRMMVLDCIAREAGSNHISRPHHGLGA